MSAGGITAAEWERHSLPRTTVDIDGFTCLVELMDSGSDGYLPVRFTANASVGTFPGDREIRLVIETEQHQHVPLSNTTYTRPILLPSGQAAVHDEFFLPKYFVGGHLRLRILDVDGPLKGYSVSNRPTWVFRPQFGMSKPDTVIRLAVIVPDAADRSGADWERLPDLRALEAASYPNARYLNAEDPGRLTHDEALDFVRQRSVYVRQWMSMSEAHTSWLGYESADVVLIAMPLLERMREVAPGRFAAIRDWVTSGGVLWVYAAGDRAAVPKFFGVRTNTADESSTPDEFLQANMKRDVQAAIPSDDWIVRELRPDPMTSEDASLSGIDRVLRWQQLSDAGHPYAAVVPVDELRAAMVRVPLEGGVVVGMVSEDPFPGSHQFWHTVRHLSGANQVWRLRRTTSLVHGTPGYWDWLLENVARPPVYAFLAVLTVFVLLVGPVAYYWTLRIGRSYLMFMIAPVLATVATLALFGYGLIADGVGTQTRIREVTWSDGGTGRGLAVTRATYFAAFRPRQGLRFPVEAATYPILEPAEASRRLRNYSGRGENQITVTEDAQILQGDFLPSRRQRQFITYRPLASQQGIEWVEPQTGPQAVPEDGPPQIINHFPQAIGYLIVRDRGGTYWILRSECPPDGTAALSSLSSPEAAKLLRELYREEQPEPPLGFNSLSRTSLAQYRSEPVEMRADRQSWAQSGDELGIIESRLKQMLSDSGSLPPGWFVGTAALDKSAVAVPEAVPVDSIHFVMGTFTGGTVE